MCVCVCVCVCVCTSVCECGVVWCGREGMRRRRCVNMEWDMQLWCKSLCMCVYFMWCVRGGKE